MFGTRRKGAIDLGKGEHQSTAGEVTGASAVGYHESGVKDVQPSVKAFHRAYRTGLLLSREGRSTLRSVRVVEHRSPTSWWFRLNPFVAPGAQASIPRRGTYLKGRRIAGRTAMVGLVVGALGTGIQHRGEVSASTAVDQSAGNIGVIAIQPNVPAIQPPAAEAQPQGGASTKTTFLSGKVACENVISIAVTPELAPKFVSSPLTTISQITGENFVTGVPDPALRTQLWGEMKALNGNKAPAPGSSYALPDQCTFR